MINDFLDPNSDLGFLSPYHVGKPITSHGQQWQSVQHFYQWNKAFEKSDRAEIQAAGTPELAHAIGQKVKRVANWNRVKTKKLIEGYWLKITQNDDYVQKLMQSGTIPIRAPLPDIVWGTGPNGNGENVLGLALEWIRSRLIEHEQQQKYFRVVADQLASRINSNAAIKQLANNPAIIGAYAEATVREFVRSAVAPLRVSTGGVVSFQLCASGRTIPQIDTIIWHPTPLPAIFEAGEFALVDVNSCLGILEIKRSMYTEVGEKMKKILDQGDDLTCSVKDWQLVLNAALGVICLQENTQTETEAVSELLQEKRAVVLLRQTKDGIEANHDAMFQLVNFLGRIRRRGQVNDGTNSIVIPERDQVQVW